MHTWTFAFIMVVLLIFAIYGIVAALQSRKKSIVAGREEMIGLTGYALQTFEHEGWVFVHSERWYAQTLHPIKENQPIRVIGIKELKLLVEPIVEPKVSKGEIA